MVDDLNNIQKKENLLDRVEAFIDTEIRPFVQQDGGDISVVEIKDDGIIRVQMHGACHSCPSSIMTLKFGVEARLMEAFPDEIKGLELAGLGPILPEPEL